MEKYSNDVDRKLRAFGTKFYRNELLKGSILFGGVILFYGLFSLMVEHFFRLDSFYRSVLFWCFVLTLVFTFVFFIGIPVLRLLRISKGLNTAQSAKMVGDYFPEIGDRLLNYFDLRNQGASNDLVMASLNQKSSLFAPFNFSKVVSFRGSLKYLPLLLIPVLVLAFFFFSGRFMWVKDSYDRVVHYNKSFAAPAPYQFFVINDSLRVLQGVNYELKVKVVGNLLPENVALVFDNRSYFMSQPAPGLFSYTFTGVDKSIAFHLEGEGVVSGSYSLEVVRTPFVSDFSMNIKYPDYTGLKRIERKGTGSITVPEGSHIKWSMMATNTDSIFMFSGNEKSPFLNTANTFVFANTIRNRYPYEVRTFNKHSGYFDKMNYVIDVIKDQHPSIVIDSVAKFADSEQQLFGLASDDYSLSKIELVWYNTRTPDRAEKVLLSSTLGSVVRFNCSFPGEIELSKGVAYEYYVAATDNDGVNGPKTSKSTIFSYNELSNDEVIDRSIKSQGSSVASLGKLVNKLKESNRSFKDLQKMQKEKSRKDFSGNKALKDLLKKELKNEKELSVLTDALKENLKKRDLSKKDDYKDALLERLERQKIKQEKTEKLLEKLKILADKMSKEQLSEELDKLQKERKTTERNLEQMVELTKRHYVIKKHENLAKKLSALSRLQLSMAAKDSINDAVKQSELNEKFNELSNELDSLNVANESLKKPMKLGVQGEDAAGVKEEQSKALKSLAKESNSDPKGHQKKAGEQMKKMAEGMNAAGSSGGAGGQETIAEDVNMLRQILENLVDFSLEEEGLMNRFKSYSTDNPAYASSIRNQSILKEHFKHIDDSLFALGSRNPKISDKITDVIGNVDYHLEKSLDRFAENEVPQALSDQHYVLEGANKLAFLLSGALDNMSAQMSGSGKGKGQGKGFQLPDIIKKQDELSKQMSGEGKGKKPGQKGDTGSEVKQGSEGTGSGENGEKGSTGQTGSSGAAGGEGGESGDGKSQGKDNGSQGKKSGNDSSKGQGEEGKVGKEGKSGKGGKGSGDSNGKDGSGEGNGGDDKPGGQGDFMNGKLFDIYKSQSELRQRLENKLSEKGLTKEGSSILDRMKEVEKDLLDKGFNSETSNKMERIKHQLIKLKEAAEEQGEEEEKESKTNIQSFDNNRPSTVLSTKDSRQSVDVLSRQALPLRAGYKRRVINYFKISDD